MYIWNLWRLIYLTEKKKMSNYTRNFVIIYIIKSAQLRKELYKINNRYEFIEYLFHAFISITKLDVNTKKQFYLKKIASFIATFIAWKNCKKNTYARLEYYINEKIRKSMLNILINYFNSILVIISSQFDTTNCAQRWTVNRSVRVPN